MWFSILFCFTTSCWRHLFNFHHYRFILSFKGSKSLPVIVSFYHTLCTMLSCKNKLLSQLFLLFALGSRQPCWHSLHCTLCKFVVVCAALSVGCCTCSDSLDGRPVSDIERQFLKNWKAMRNPELRLMAPPGDITDDSGQLSAGTAKTSALSVGTRQHSVLVVSARQSKSEPTNTEMAMVPCSSVSTKQPLHYDSQLSVFCVCHLPVIYTAHQCITWNYLIQTAWKQSKPVKSISRLSHHNGFVTFSYLFS